MVICLSLSSSYKTAHGHWPYANVCRVPCGGVVNMMLVFSIIFLYSLHYTGVYVFNWPISVQVIEGILSIGHAIIIIKSEVSTFPIVIIFFVVVYLRCLLHHILLLQIRFELKIVFVYLYMTPSHYHHCASLSEWMNEYLFHRISHICT